MNLLLQVLTDPSSLAKLNLREWDRLLPLARRAGVLGRLQADLAERDLLERVPEPVRPHLEAAAVIAAEHERRLRWEVNRIQRALATLSVPIVLLKGAAYVLAGLPCARGRLAADVDILVPRQHLTSVEQALQAWGWSATKLDEYDQRYYRRWMHELPPLRHRLRGTEVDIHHTILPRTSRLQPDPARLLADARPLEGMPLRVLAPADMVLHSAAHAFYDGDLSHGLRDLLDLHDLLCCFSASPGSDDSFWDNLLERARQLDLERPLFYALWYCRKILHTPMPASIMEALRRAGPSRPVLALMDALVGCVVLAEPSRSGRYSSTVIAARWLLYVRSHWLRMPPLLLAGHLLHKAFTRLRAHPSGNGPARPLENRTGPRAVGAGPAGKTGRKEYIARMLRYINTVRSGERTPRR